MPSSLAEKETHFESHADNLAEILRGVARRWGAIEQVDDDIIEQDLIKRYFISYEYPTPEALANVTLSLWIGQSAQIIEGRSGKSLQMKRHPLDYECATIQIDLDAEHGEDFVIDGEHRVHSAGELKDRLGVMWNADHWHIRHEYVEENAALYRQFVPQDVLFRREVKNVITLLRKLGALWEGEEQLDNTPDPDDETGMLGSLFGRGSGKKRFAVSYVAPAFKLDEKQKARIVTGSAYLELWQGKKGNVRKAPNSRRIEHAKTSEPTQINIIFSTDGMAIKGVDTTAKNTQELSAILSKLWKQDAFGLKS